MKYTAMKVKHTWEKRFTCVRANSEAEAAKEILGVDEVERVCVGNHAVGETVCYFSTTRKNPGIFVCDIKEIEDAGN